jgi:hypothetical protein
MMKKSPLSVKELSNDISEVSPEWGPASPEAAGFADGSLQAHLGGEGASGSDRESRFSFGRKTAALLVQATGN